MNAKTFVAIVAAGVATSLITLLITEAMQGRRDRAAVAPLPSPVAPGFNTA